MNQIVEIVGEKIFVTLPTTENSGKVLINGVEMDFNFRTGSVGGQSTLLINGRCFSVETVQEEEGWTVRTNEQDLKASVTDEARARLGRNDGSSSGKAVSTGKISAPMPGLIVKIETEIGKFIEKGAGVVIIEAMKMENEIRATVSGVVTEIFIVSGQSVEKGQNLLTIKPQGCCPNTNSV